MALGQDNNLNSPNVSPKVQQYDIRVMPPKFHQYLAVKHGTSWSKVLMIMVIVSVIVGLLGAGGYFLYLQMNQPGQNLGASNLNQLAENNTNINQNTENLNAENLNAFVNLNANENLNLSINENVNVNTNANSNANLNTNINANANANTNTNVPVGIVSYTSSLDTDNDKLTDVEEDLYQTEKRTADTDGDGYLDGDELINGYNPKMAGGAKLETSGLVNKYTNPTYNFEVFYPTSWLARPEDQSLQVVLFITATEEFMKVSVEDNPNRLDIVNWYLQQSPGADLNLLSKVITQFTGQKKYETLVSPDKLTYYILDPSSQDKVYVISYNIGSLKELNFLSTFRMMINSFKVVPKTP